MKRFMVNVLFALISTTFAAAQSEGDMIINEIGNCGTKKGAYQGGDFVELLVLKPGGVNMAGWYLTDLSSLSGNAKETEGLIRFSEAEGSVFRQTIPQGTYVLVWISNKDSIADLAQGKEDVSVTDGNNRIVVFAYNSPKHMDGQEGIVNLTGKDNLVLLSKKEKKAAVDAVVWEGTSKWEGCKATSLPKEILENGKVAWFVPNGKTIDAFKENTDPQCWKSGETAATPGTVNPGFDDLILKKK